MHDIHPDGDRGGRGRTGSVDSGHRPGRRRRQLVRGAAAADGGGLNVRRFSGGSLEFPDIAISSARTKPARPRSSCRRRRP
jgi:hypothetical protein